MVKRTTKLEDEICDRISKGETLRAICRDKHMPSWVTVYSWISKCESFSLRIARARELGHDAIAEECFDISDEEPPRGADGKIDSGYVAWQKNRVWTRTQLLAKWAPKKYGEKTQLEHSGTLKLEDLIAGGQ